MDQHEMQSNQNEETVVQGSQILVALKSKTYPGKDVSASSVPSLSETWVTVDISNQLQEITPTKVFMHSKKYLSQNLSELFSLDYNYKDGKNMPKDSCIFQ
jgi:hypothetical protein